MRAALCVRYTVSCSPAKRNLRRVHGTYAARTLREQPKQKPRRAQQTKPVRLRCMPAPLANSARRCCCELLLAASSFAYIMIFLLVFYFERDSLFLFLSYFISHLSIFVSCALFPKFFPSLSFLFSYFSPNCWNREYKEESKKRGAQGSGPNGKRGRGTRGSVGGGKERTKNKGELVLRLRRAFF